MNRILVSLGWQSPRLRQRWVLEDRDVFASEDIDVLAPGEEGFSHSFPTTKKRVKGIRGIPKMAVLYDFMITRISTELCGIVVKNLDIQDGYGALLGEWFLICFWFLPVYAVWCYVIAYVNHFDPCEENLTSTRGGECTYLISIILLLGGIYNLSACNCGSSSYILDDASFSCALHSAFMAGHRFFLFFIGLITWFALELDDRRQARIFLMLNSSTGLLTGIQWSLRAMFLWTIPSSSLPELIRYTTVGVDVLFPFSCALLPATSMLPADLSMWVVRLETLFKAGLTNILMAAVSAQFTNQGTYGKARHLSGYVTPLYAYAFKVLYFDYTANIHGNYVDPGSLRFVLWVTLHVPLVISMILLGVSITEELHKFHGAQLARNLLPLSAFLALLSTGMLEMIMVRQTHAKSKVSRFNRVLVRCVCGAPLLFLQGFDSYAMLWIPAVTLFVIAMADRFMRTKRTEQLANAIPTRMDTLPLTS